MGRVRDGGSGSQGGGNDGGFSNFGVGRAGLAGVRAVNFDTIRTLRRERYSHGNEFFVFDWNGAVGNGQFVESPKGFHYVWRQSIEFFDFAKIFFGEHKIRSFVWFLFWIGGGFPCGAPATLQFALLLGAGAPSG
jgi:hypothetical protein